MQDMQDWLAICELKARYCRFVDTHQPEAWVDLFIEDLEFEAPGDRMPPIKGRVALTAMIKSFMQDSVSAHHVHSPEISITGDEAQVIWAMQDRVIFGGRSITGYGHYHERLVRQNGQWKIASLKLTRLHIDHQQKAEG